MIRCYNCGVAGHKTQTCPSWGPYHPAPGKTSSDYEDKVREVSELFAADIIREHQGGEATDAPLNPPSKSNHIPPVSELRLIANPCRTCLAPAERSCVSSGGNRTKPHAARVADAAGGG